MQKNIVITGVSSGLGYALANEFCCLGHVVYGCARTAGMTQKLLDHFTDNFFFQKLDITDHPSVIKWAEQITRPGMTIDVLINNASVINPKGFCWKLSHKEIKKAMEINVVATFSCIQAFVPAMISHRKGMIINISSSAGKHGIAEFAPYCASKFAIEGLTQSLSRELPQGLATACLNPGAVNTQMLASGWPHLCKKAPSATFWAKTAAPFILSLNGTHNGFTLSCRSN